MPYRIVRRIAELVGPARGRKIALLGAAYKADVDDARESPTTRIDALLRERGYVTAIYDPLVTRYQRPLCDSLEEAVTGADALVLLTPHAAFRDDSPDGRWPRSCGCRASSTRGSFSKRRSGSARGFECYVLGRPFRRSR